MPLSLQVFESSQGQTLISFLRKNSSIELSVKSSVKERSYSQLLKFALFLNTNRASLVRP